MTNSPLFVGRAKLLSLLNKLYSEQKHVLIPDPRASEKQLQCGKRLCIFNF